MREVAPAMHWAIVYVDVAGFGDRRRTNRDQIAVREGLYRALRRALKRSGVRCEDCRWEDRGDGVLILVPADVPKERLAVALPLQLAAALESCNAKAPETARIELRAALHAGEVHHDEHGVAGSAINLAARLLDAAPLKDALRESAGPLALIASDWFYDEVVRHHPESEPDAYRPIHVSVKETRTRGWIRLPGPRAARRAEGARPAGRPGHRGVRHRRTAGPAAPRATRLVSGRRLPLALWRLFFLRRYDEAVRLHGEALRAGTRPRLPAAGHAFPMTETEVGAAAPGPWTRRRIRPPRAAGR
ncbi:hypothetical protein [Spirillospora sp. NPDC029432]|uniref:hypothetical protein n=1 Tax=Spirillospora sp. NPDC029432 TaxID=3154599 RepID=UPI0034545AD1